MKFIPSSKFDLEACEVLQKTSSEVLRPQIRNLLVWVQDVNWPVAQPVMNALKQQGEYLIEPLSELLRRNDETWKYNLIAHFIPLLEFSVAKELEPEILRIATSPTESEVSEEVNLVAKQQVNALKANA